MSGALALGLARALAGAAGACPFCFSRAAENSPFGKAITLAIIGLVLSVFSILTVLVVAVVRLERRKARAEGRA